MLKRRKGTGKKGGKEEVEKEGLPSSLATRSSGGHVFYFSLLPFQSSALNRHSAKILSNMSRGNLLKTWLCRVWNVKEESEDLKNYWVNGLQFSSHCGK